jgi:flagellar hook-associated protein 2
MTTIGTLGIGSGLDLNGLLDKLTAAEQLPLQQIQTQQTNYTTKLSAYGTLQSFLGTLQTAAKKLADSGFMGAYKTTSSAADVLTASADGTAMTGNYAVSVDHLAQAQSLVSSGVATTATVVGAGAATTVTIDFGTITGTLNGTTGTYAPGATFDADVARSPISLSIDSTNNTLSGIRDAINKAAGTALSASIVNDGSASGNRLVLTSSVTGQKSSMRIAVSGDGAVQSLLADDPTAVQNLRQTAIATDAGLSVNGIAITSASNTVASSIQGVTLTLVKSGSSVVGVARDGASVKAAVNDFVNAYNKLQGQLKSLSTYDVTKHSGGPLVGDSAVRSIQTRLRSALVAPQPGGPADPKLVSDVGVAFQKDGTLAVDATKLDAALSGNPAGVAALFVGSSATTGVAAGISSAIDGFNAPDGLLKAATDGTNSILTRLGKNYSDMQATIDAKIARYRAEFQQLDTVMSGINSTSAYLTQQFASKTQ